MNDLNLLKVEKQFCLNYRIKGQDCKICTNICPKHAIAIDNSTLAITINEDCNNCGVCLRHCPAQAIQWNDTKRYPLSSKDGKVEIYCQKLKCDGYVSCLANLNEYELVYLALQADISLCIDKIVCKQCNIKIEDEIQLLLDKANDFLIKINGKKITLHFKEKNTSEQINRRELFSFLFTKMKQSIVEALPIATEATDYRYLLLSELTKLKISQNSNASPLFFGLTTNSCNMCGVCTKICKNKALYIEIDTIKAISKLKHDQSRCTGCGACQKICPQNALSLLTENSSLQSVCNQTAIEVAARKMTSCSNCNKYIIAIDDNICDACKREQNKKMQEIY